MRWWKEKIGFSRCQDVASLSPENAQLRQNRKDSVRLEERGRDERCLMIDMYGGLSKALEL